MRSWPQPELPVLPSPAPPLRLHDTATGQAREITGHDGQARMYVCGITPYDATHLGHAATYVTFDLVNRALRAAGLRVRYAQNVTDVDDPLFERAARDGVDWRELGARETQLFRDDMTALRVLPPDDLVGVEESMTRHVERVAELVAAQVTYTLGVPEAEADPQAPSQDVYLDLASQPSFGSVSHLGPERMRELFVEFGGDPDRPGKRDPLDPLLWRGARRGEPSWPGPDAAGPGRPGWHLECTTIALDRLGPGFDLQGGGRDLAFPHHEMSAVQAVALPGVDSFARAYAHQGMVAYDGAKMSKSLGNLVRVSDLRAAGEDPMAVRLVMLAHHYRQDWEYADADLTAARQRLAAWRAGLGGERPAVLEEEARLAGEVAAALADDLGAPAALAAIDAWVGQHGPVQAPLVRDAVDALLGVAL